MLEEQLIYAKHYCILLESGPGWDVLPLKQTALALHDTLDLVGYTIASLQARVIALDSRNYGTTVGSFGELVVRAQTAVITLQLQELRRVLSRTPRPEGLLSDIGRFRTIDDVLSFVEAELRRVDKMWVGYRASRDIARDVLVSSPRRQLYHRRVCEAQGAMRAIGDNPEIFHFLRSGIMQSDCPVLQSACVHIAMMFVISLDVGLNHPLFPPPSVIQPPQVRGL